MLKQTNDTTNKSKHRPKQAKKLGRATGLAGTSVPRPPQVAPSGGKSLSARPLSTTEFRAELKAQQVERLLAQVDQQAEEVVDTILSSHQVVPAGSIPKGDKTYAVIKLGLDVEWVNPSGVHQASELEAARGARDRFFWTSVFS